MNPFEGNRLMADLNLVMKSIKISLQYRNLQKLELKMKQSSQNNKSALLMAGQNSLYKIDSDNYRTVSRQQNPNRQNEVLYQSNVHQVYKRPGYNAQDIPYRPQGIDNKQKVMFNKLHTQNNVRETNRERRNYNQNQKKNNSVSHLELQSQELQQYYLTSPAKKSAYSYYKIDNQRIKKLMMKLTFGRLRKMQALVRGFLVRRKVYPKLLEQYLIAKSLLSLIEANVVYREISTIIMQTITFPKYQDQGELVQMYKGRQKILQDLIYESVIKRVIQKQLKPIIQDSLTQRGMLMNRPQITFGFNLRDPLQLLMYEKLLAMMNVQLKSTCQDSIKQQALDRRQLFVIDQWIEKHKMLQPLYEEIANEILEENIGEYVVEDILQKLVREGAFIIAQTVYNNEVNQWYVKTVEEVREVVSQALMEEAFGEVIGEMGYGLEKKIQQNDPL